MPRRKAADRDKPHKTRCRSGCLSCRKRRIRCDGGFPTCNNCIHKGLRCSREIPLKWAPDYNARGVAFGRAGLWGKHDATTSTSAPSDLSRIPWVRYPRIEHHHFVSDSGEDDHDEIAALDIAEDCSVVSTVTGSDTSDLWQSPSPAPDSVSADLIPYLPQTPCSPRTSNTDFLLNYFANHLCPLTTSSGAPTSPLFNTVLPYAISASQLTLDAVLTLAAQHLSRRDPSVSTLACTLEGRALNGLRGRLARQDALTTAHDPSIPLAMMILCLSEISSRCNERWVVHLKGARDLVRARRSLTPASIPTSQEDLIQISDRFFAHQDVIGRTACGETPIFNAEYWNASDEVIDTWLGCSPRLLTLICRITDLHRTMNERNRLPAGEAATLEAALKSLRQVNKAGDSRRVSDIAETNRVAAMVFLHCALYGATPKMAAIKGWVRQLLQHTKSALDHGEGHGLLWPLFVAAVELDPIEDDGSVVSSMGHTDLCRRYVVLGCLEQMKALTVGNIARVRQVICRVWQARDGELEHDDDKQTSKLNDWDRFVAPHSSNISLA